MNLHYFFVARYANPVACDVIRVARDGSNLLLSGRQKKEWLDDYNEDVIARSQNSKSLNRAIAEGQVKITGNDC